MHDFLLAPHIHNLDVGPVPVHRSGEVFNDEAKFTLGEARKKRPSDLPLEATVELRRAGRPVRYPAGLVVA